MSQVQSQPTQSRPIRQLSAGVINKIAAGEVIERPASVVKELLENSVDAGSTQIELTLENGGIDLIRVTDNGHGIAQGQLELAVTSHATSKIEDADDLFRVGTFGFRGEALASIAEVSQFSVASRTSDNDCGFELIVNGGHREPIAPRGMPVGTSIQVQNLFYNTPVRRKFMRTPQTERGHIVEAFTRIALANPQVHLTLIHNGKTQFDLPAADNWRDRIATFFGAEIADSLIPVGSDDFEVELTGFVVSPSVSRANNRMQYLFLNGRYIRDRSLQHALSEAYRGLLMTGRYPVAFLRMNMPAELVDVNVHPAKLEVRFQNGGKLYSQLLSTIRNKFLTTDLTAQAQLSRGPRPGQQTDQSERTDSSNPPALPKMTENQHKMAFRSSAPTIDWTQPRHSANGPAGQTGYSDKSSATTPATRFDSFPLESDRDSLEASIPGHHSTADLGESGSTFGLDDAQNNEVSLDTTAQAKAGHSLALQVHNTYLISETEEGMIVIDQHALHERIIYEQLKVKILSGKLETQRLLVPEPVTLPPAEAAAVLENAELLSTIGMSVEPFGGDTVLVSGYPAMLTSQNPAEMLRGIVELVMAEGRTLEQRDLIDELLHMISCKAAIKAGDKLTPEEISDLLEHRDFCQDSHHCPHGRPTALVFSREELDRRFKRI